MSDFKEPVRACLFTVDIVSRDGKVLNDNRFKPETVKSISFYGDDIIMEVYAIVNFSLFDVRDAFREAPGIRVSLHDRDGRVHDSFTIDASDVVLNIGTLSSTDQGQLVSKLILRDCEISHDV